MSIHPISYGENAIPTLRGYAFRFAKEGVQSGGVIVSPWREELIRAIQERRILHLTYQKKGGSVEKYVIAPWDLVPGGETGEELLVAFAYNRNDFRSFRLSRILSIRELGEEFDPREFYPRLATWPPRWHVLRAWPLQEGEYPAGKGGLGRG